MTSRFSSNLKNIPNISISKEKIKRPLSKKENMTQYIKKKQNLSHVLAKYESSQGFSTQNFTLPNEYKTENDTAITLPSLDFIETAREKALITNYKPTKIKLRNKTSSKNKNILNKALTELNFMKNSKKSLKKEKNIKKIQNFQNFQKYQGVPKQFMEAMRLDINDNIIKANKFIKDEKKRMVKENPNLKYYILFQNKKNREHKEELRRVYEYEMKKNILNRNKKNIIEYNLNDYYTNLLLKENEQHFNINSPMIENNKFNNRFMILKNEIEEKKSYPNKDINIIFANLLKSKVFINNEKKIIVFKIDLLYKKLISSLKKSAIEFKNIKIPFSEYVEYYNKAKSITHLLYNNEYSNLKTLIIREKKENEKNENKDSKVIESLNNYKFPIYIIDFLGKSILILVTKNKLYKSMSKIIQYGGNVNAQDFKGRTALHFAVMNNDIIGMTILLYYLANTDISDNYGNYPLNFINTNNRDSYIIKELLMRCSMIRKYNIKYRSWKDFDIYVRRGIQFYLYNNITKDKYNSIFYYIENPILYYK